MKRDRPAARRPSRWRALAAPLVIAGYTVVAGVGALLALAPAILARGPRGHPRREPVAPPEVATAKEDPEALGG